MKKTFLIATLAVLVATLLVTGCGRNAEEAPTDEFIILNGAEPQSLDPHLISGVPEHRIYYSLFEGLVSSDPRTATAVPGVAERWEVSDDGLTWTFYLRETTWTDGTAITAQSFVDSWLHILDPEVAARYAWFPGMFIEGASEYNSGEAGPEAVQIRAVDDLTFQFDLVGPLPYVLDALAHYSFAVVPLHAMEEHGAEWTSPENFVGNGPFMLEEWRPQEKVSVIPNPTYWDKDAVKLGRITYLPVDDNNTAFRIYENGEADWLTEIPLDQIEAVRPRADYQNVPRLGTYYYVLQTERPPLDDPRVRKALSMSFDREELVSKVTKGGQIPATSMVPPMTGYEGIKGNATDIEAARELLAGAGYPDGQGFPKLTVLYNTSEAHKKVGEYIQQEWKENLGIDVELVNQEWATYLDTRRQGDFLVARAGWIGDYQDPNTFLDMFVISSAMNGGKYTSEEYDQLIAQAARMPAGDDRFEVLMQAEELLITEDQAVMPIYFYTTNELIDTEEWGGWYPNIMSWHPTKHIFKK